MFMVERIEPDDPVVVAVHLHPVVLDVEQKRILAVALGVKTVLGMRREHLQRIALEILRVRAFRRRLVFDDRRPLGIVDALEAVALEFELARLRLQPAQIFLGVVRRQRLRFRHVLLAVLPEPAE